MIFSVPESEREKRHQLRSQLTRLGFGTVAPGVWAAPGHLEAEATGVLEWLDVTGYAEVFRGHQWRSAGGRRGRSARRTEVVVSHTVSRIGTALPDGVVPAAAALRVGTVTSRTLTETALTVADAVDG